MIRERYASLLLKLDLCVKKESFAALGDECKLMQEQVRPQTADTHVTTCQS